MCACGMAPGVLFWLAFCFVFCRPATPTSSVLNTAQSGTARRLELQDKGVRQCAINTTTTSVPNWSIRRRVCWRHHRVVYSEKINQMIHYCFRVCFPVDSLLNSTKLSGNRSLAYLLWEGLVCRSCNGVDTHRSGASWSTHLEESGTY